MVKEDGNPGIYMSLGKTIQKSVRNHTQGSRNALDNSSRVQKAHILFLFRDPNMKPI
jgi:hypothetical protein